MSVWQHSHCRLKMTVNSEHIIMFHLSLWLSFQNFHLITSMANIQIYVFTINCNVFLELYFLEFQSAESINASALRQNNVNVRKDKWLRLVEIQVTWSGSDWTNNKPASGREISASYNFFPQPQFGWHSSLKLFLLDSERDANISFLPKSDETCVSCRGVAWQK